MSLLARREPSIVGATLKTPISPLVKVGTNPHLELCPNNVLIFGVDELMVFTEAANGLRCNQFDGLLATEDKLS